MASRQNGKSPRRPPARSPEEYEERLVSMSMELAERQIREGTATSQVLTHFLKAASTRERLEREKLQRENELLRARAEALESSKRVEELYADALRAMRSYSGQPEPEEDYDD